MRERRLRTIGLSALVLGFWLVGLPWAAVAQKVHVTKVKPKKTDTSQSAEPDKVLYDRAVDEMKHTKYTEARLDLQTLINTYPDSEYLAKAKLTIADSFYKEGGTSNLTQAVDEYKNFIVFFPFLDEAAYAQMQVAMCHYRMMEKSDRDSSQAEAAEDELRTFLLKFPDSPLVPRAQQDLRNVQEVLADGEYRIARFYYTKQDYRPAAARLVELTARYPLYSQSDTALYMLGNIYMRAKQASKNEDDKNHWGELAGECYSRIVKDYPLSTLVPGAKAHLTSMGMPIPKADSEALAAMQKQQSYEKEHHPNPVLAAPVGMFRSNPDVHLAAQVGQPNLNPPDDTVSATEVLNQGAAGPKFNIAAGVASSGPSSEASETESVDSSFSDAPAPTSATPTATNVPVTTTGAQIIDSPTAASNQGAAPAAPLAPSTMTSLPTAPSSGEAPAVVTTQNSAAPPASAGSNSTTTAAPPDGTSHAVSTAANSSSNSSSAQSSAQTTNGKDDSKNESSSKKKKGLHKLIP